mgnify:CR=1 FL=1
MSVTLYLAIPCYNEEAVLPETARRLREKFTALRAAGTIGQDAQLPLVPAQLYLSAVRQGNDGIQRR